MRGGRWLTSYRVPHWDCQTKVSVGILLRGTAFIRRGVVRSPYSVHTYIMTRSDPSRYNILPHRHVKPMPQSIASGSKLGIDGRWKMEDGRWKMEDGRWKMEDGRWKMDMSTVRYGRDRPGELRRRISTRRRDRRPLNDPTLAFAPLSVCRDDVPLTV